MPDRVAWGLRAARAIPGLAAWTDPGQARPITPVLPGGRLYNGYRAQRNDAGRVALDGLPAAVIEQVQLAGQDLGLGHASTGDPSCCFGQVLLPRRS